MSLRSRNRASTFYLALAISFGAAAAFSACASGVPDELLQERVEAALAAASDVPADALSVVVMDGIVTISGSVVCQECGAAVLLAAPARFSRVSAPSSERYPASRA